MKALIVPDTDSYIRTAAGEKQIVGKRVAQVEPDGNIFPVAEPYFWVDCSDDVIADRYYWDELTRTIKPLAQIISQQSWETLWRSPLRKQQRSPDVLSEYREHCVIPYNESNYVEYHSYTSD